MDSNAAGADPGGAQGACAPPFPQLILQYILKPFLTAAFVEF